MEGHERDLFQYNRIVDGIHGVCAPRKRTMTMNKNRGNRVRIFSLEGLLDHQTCFLFILAFDFRLCHFASAGNLAIEIIAMSGTKREDAAPCLCKACCPTAVSMD